MYQVERWPCGVPVSARILVRNPQICLALSDAITQENAPAQSSLFGLIDRCRLTQFETVFEPARLVEVVGMCAEETAQPRRFAAAGLGLRVSYGLGL
jgi:hypothetical protein